MLTKDLLRLRAAGEYLKPRFLQRDDREVLELAAGLIDIYRNGTGERADTLDAMADAFVLRYQDLKLTRGILKTVRARAVFSGENDDFPYTEYRKELFRKTAKMLQAGTLPPQAEQIRDILHNDQRLIYGDLPENETLVKFRTLSPEEVADRYNVALVQGALLTAGSMTLTIPLDTPPADLRNLFRSLRFFRLLFSGTIEKKNLILRVDGPASILENSLKYSMQLACFFPSVCRLPVWKMSCTIRRSTIRNNGNLKSYKLNLSHEDGLRNFRPQFSGHVEEHRMFLEYFRSGDHNWQIDDAPGYLTPSPQCVIFPDFAFHSGSGRTVFLELFHRWHRTQLEERLQQAPENLIIGVDRALLKKDGILKKMLEENRYFQENGFFFKDFPGSENVLKKLDQKSGTPRQKSK